MLSQRQHQHQAQLLLMLDRTHPASYSSLSAQLILPDATSTSAGILLPSRCWCSPPCPKLPTNSRPVCYRQETDFHPRAGRVSEGSTGISAGTQAPSKSQPATHAVSHCPSWLGSTAELHIKAARATSAQREDVHVSTGGGCVH